MCLNGLVILALPEVLTLGSPSVDGATIGLLDSVIALAVVILSGLGSKLLLKGIKKLGLQVDISQKMLLEGAVQKGIKYAAEQAAKKLKLEEKVLKGEEKLEIAAIRVIDKIPGVSKEEAKKLVEESLVDALEGSTSLVANIIQSSKR